MNAWITYCPENEHEVAAIVDGLANKGVYVQRDNREQGLTETQLEALRNNKWPIILLVSDNLLKSGWCVDHFPEFLREFNDQVLPVIAPGRYTDASTGAASSVPTVFHTINEVMHYRDFWYEKWIQLRKQRNELPEEAHEAQDVLIAQAQKISTTIGSFLRTLRDMESTSFEQFTQGDYAKFFERFELEEQFNQEFVAPQPEPVFVPVVETIAEPQAELVEETPQQDPIEALEERVALIPEAEAELLVEEPRVQAEEHTIDLYVAEPEISEEPVQETITPAVQEETPTLETPAYGDDDDELDGTPEGEDEESPRLSESFIMQVNREMEEAAKIMQDLEPVSKPFKPAEIPAVENLAVASAEEKQELVAAVPTIEASNASAVLKQQALDALAANDTTLGLDLLTQASVANPLDAELHLLLAQLYSTEAHEDKRKADCHYKKALIIEPDSAALHFGYGMLLESKFGKSKKASQHLKKALKIERNAEYALALAELFDKSLEKPSKALKYYKKACKLNPDFRTETLDAHYGYSTSEPEAEEEDESDDEAAVENIQRPKLDQTVLVTGATSGIGKATAELLAEQGYRLILTGRRSDRLDILKASLEERFAAEVETLVFDVRNLEEAGLALQNLPDAFRNIDVLVNNAGLAKGLDFIHEGNIQDWETMIDTNIKGLLYITRLVSPGMVERQSGHIINISSTAGKETYPMGNVYSATKFAVDALSKSMRMDLHRFGVRVTSIAPGHTEDTEFALVRFENAEKAKIYDDFTPLSASDVAEAILFAINRPAHVNISEILLTGTQQASAMLIDRSGRK